MKHASTITRSAIALASLSLVGAADLRLQPGLWEIRNTPGVATLDGRALAELPIGPIKTETICLAASDVADPARFLARDIGQDCRTGKATAVAGKVEIAGTCPNQVEGPDSTFELKGRFESGRYEVDFATTAIGENGRMTFSGKMTGRRVGACTAAPT